MPLGLPWAEGWRSGLLDKAGRCASPLWPYGGLAKKGPIELDCSRISATGTGGVVG